MKRRIKIMIAMVATTVMLAAITVMAGTQGYTTYYNGDFAISCYISCNSSTGIGKTKGAPTGYYNRATIIIYDDNGYSLGNATTHGRQEAVASKTDTGDVYSALSCHLVTDASYNSVMPLYQQVQLSESR